MPRPLRYGLRQLAQWAGTRGAPPPETPLVPTRRGPGEPLPPITPGSGLAPPNGQLQFHGRPVTQEQIFAGVGQMLPESVRAQPFGQALQSAQLPAGAAPLQWNGRDIPWENVIRGAQTYLPPQFQNMSLDEIRAFMTRGGGAR